MKSVGFILVLTLVAIVDININAIEARNIVKPEKPRVVEQDPRPYNQMLPRGPVPPSGPSHGYPPPETLTGLSDILPSPSIHILPKGVPYPPGGPSHGSTPDPPGPQPTPSSGLSDILPSPIHPAIHILPKGLPYPPSGPSHGSTPDPPGPTPAP